MAGTEAEEIVMASCQRSTWHQNEARLAQGLGAIQSLHLADVLKTYRAVNYTRNRFGPKRTSEWIKWRMRYLCQPYRELGLGKE